MGNIQIYTIDLQRFLLNNFPHKWTIQNFHVEWLLRSYKVSEIQLGFMDKAMIVQLVKLFVWVTKDSSFFFFYCSYVLR